MYVMQLGSTIRLFETLKQMVDTFTGLSWVQRTCCTLFDYSQKMYAEGKDYEFQKTLNWHDMP